MYDLFNSLSHIEYSPDLNPILGVSATQNWHNIGKYYFNTFKNKC